jgi:hypothetical protein
MRVAAQAVNHAAADADALVSLSPGPALLPVLLPPVPAALPGAVERRLAVLPMMLVHAPSAFRNNSTTMLHHCERNGNRTELPFITCLGGGVAVGNGRSRPQQILPIAER